MKAFRVKLFGDFITRLPEFNLTRHEDVPLPQSFAEPYHSEEDIKTAQFVPSQDLSGAMIPMTGQDAIERKLKKEEERDHLLKQFQDISNNNLQTTTSVTEGETEPGFELVSSESEKRLVCVPSSASVGAIGKGSRDTITHTRSNSSREIMVSDEAIQSALEGELGEPKKSENLNRKWVFSAQFSFSLRQETSREKPTTPALCNGTNKNLLGANTGQEKRLMDSIKEEGVELVPFVGLQESTAGSDASLQLEKGQDNVSVLYVKDGIKKELENDSRVSVLYVEETKKTVE